MVRCLAAFSVLAATLTACSRLDAPYALPAGGGSYDQQTALHRAKFVTIFAFGGSDGLGPSGALLALNHKLYGTTSGGGKYGHGIVFSITPTGNETVIHSFRRGGRVPTGSLLAVDGTLYGATKYGGAHRGGAVFAIRANGSKVWTYDFKGGSDGAAPAGGLTNLKGVLYGVTGSTFFQITQSGDETALRAFTRGRDGGLPNGNLFTLRGAFYGTANDGGRGKNSPGIVMRLTTSGGETVLHEFGSGGDGRNPSAGLVLLNGVFYGTTAKGGKYDEGTIFSITRDGRERVVHDFGSGSDGRSPACRLAAFNGKLYGTTPYGGLYNRGTVFEVNTSGKERALYTFTGNSDGGVPASGLVMMDGTLYGTTTSGPSSHPYGTVFALRP